MRTFNRLSLITTITLLSLITTGRAAELDQALEDWLNEKPKTNQLTNEKKEVIVFLKDERVQADLSGLSLAAALSSQQQMESIHINMLSRDLEQNYQGLKAQEKLWSSRALVMFTDRALLKKLKKDNRVEAVISNQTVLLDVPMRGASLLEVNEDTHTYGLKLIKTEEAWNLGVRGEKVRVGIIDSGIDPYHPDLAGKAIVLKDFTKDGHTDDRNGHGTHVAGTIAGGNASGTHIGVAPDAELVIAKVFDNRGSTDTKTLLRAMEWMLNPDEDESTADAPRVVNNSWGNGAAFAIGYRNIVQTWRRFQIFPNFAAGNSGPLWMSTGAPARYPFSYAVAAVNEKTSVTSFSSRGPTLWLRAWGTEEGLPWYKKWMPLLYTKPDISAPGYEILSALPEGKYGRMSGTSMATPHISGVIALMLEANPRLSVEQIEQILNETAVDLRGSGKDNASGHGLVQTDRAVAQALQVQGELSESFVDSDLAQWEWQTP